MKTTMSKRNIAKMNNYLSKGMKVADVSKHLKIEVKTLKLFMAKPKARTEDEADSPSSTVSK